MRGQSISYTARELAWIEKNCVMARRALQDAFCKKFGRQDITLDNIKALCSRKGWKTGRDGRLQPGHVPANKGKKMPYNVNSARTQFKKGSRTGRANEVYKTIGTERLSKDGYLERKIHDGLPMQSRWRAVHLVNWEKLNGPLPKGMVLKCLDCDKRNTAPSNWEAVPQGVNALLNSRWSSLRYNDAPEELKPTIMAISKLKYAKKVKGRAAQKGTPT